MTELRDQMVRSPIGGWIHPKDPGEPGGKLNRKRWSVTPADIGALQVLCRGRRVLEIGTGTGMSAAGMAACAASVVTMDIDPWVRDTIAPHLAGVADFRFGREAVREDEKFDFIFIDGLHQRDSVISDMRWSLEHLDRPGMIVLHDITDPEVQQGLESVGIEPKDVAVIHTECGLCIVPYARLA